MGLGGVGYMYSWSVAIAARILRLTHLGQVNDCHGLCGGSTLCAGFSCSIKLCEADMSPPAWALVQHSMAVLKLFFAAASLPKRYSIFAAFRACSFRSQICTAVLAVLAVLGGDSNVPNVVVASAASAASFDLPLPLFLLLLFVVGETEDTMAASAAGAVSTGTGAATAVAEGVGFSASSKRSSRAWVGIALCIALAGWIQNGFDRG